MTTTLLIPETRDTLALLTAIEKHCRVTLDKHFLRCFRFEILKKRLEILFNLNVQFYHPIEEGKKAAKFLEDTWFKEHQQ
jgi:hypothetical protein